MTLPHSPQLPFTSQRLVYLGLIMGMCAYAVVVAVVVQQNGGKGMSEEPFAALDMVACGIGGAAAVIALFMRSVLRQRAEHADAESRSAAHFQATLVPLAMLEGGALFALTVWLLNGNPVPSLVAALVLLALAIYIVPFQDPDAPAR